MSRRPDPIAEHRRQIATVEHEVSRTGRHTSVSKIRVRVAGTYSAIAALRLWSGNQHEVWVAVTRCLRVQWKRIRRVELSRFLNPHPTRLTCFTSLL